MTKHLLIGRLRRDTMILGSSEDTKDLMQQGEDAVKQGRAAEVFIIETVGYFTESDQNWGGIDRYQGGTFDTPPSSVPALNPLEGEQESLATSDREVTNPQLEIEKAAQAQVDSGVTVDAGEADRLHAMGTQVAPAVVAGEDGKAPSQVRTSSFDSAIADAKGKDTKSDKSGDKK